MRAAATAALIAAACSTPIRPPPTPASPPRAAPADDWIDRRYGDPAWHVPGSVAALAWSRDEQRLVVGSPEAGVVVLDVATGLARARVAGATDLARISLVDDDHALVSTWDAATERGEVLAVDLHARTRAPTAIAGAFASVVPGDAGAVLVQPPGRGELAVVDRATGAARRTLDRSAGYRAPEIAGGRAIAIRGDLAGVWDLATGARVGRFGAGMFATLSPDGTALATGAFHDGDGWQVDVYRIDDGARLATLTHDCQPWDAAFSPDGHLLAARCEGSLRVWDVRSGKLAASPDDVRWPTGVLSFSPSGRWLATGSVENTVHLWDTASWTEREIGDAHRAQVGHVVVLPGGARFLTDTFADDTVRVWDAASGRGEVVRSAHRLEASAPARGGVLLVDADDQQAWLQRWPSGASAPAQSVALASSWGIPAIPHALTATPDGGAIVVYGGAVHVLDADLHERWASRPVVANDMGNGAAAISADARHVAVVGDASLMLVDLAAREAHNLGAFGCGSIADLAWSPDGARLAIVDGETSLRLIDVARGAELGSYALPETIHHLAFAPDGHLLALGDGALYDLAPDGALATVRVPDATAFGLSPDGASIYVGLQDGTAERVVRAAALRGATRSMLAAAPARGVCPGPGELRGFGYGTIGGDGLHQVRRGKITDDQPEAPEPPPPDASSDD